MMFYILSKFIWFFVQPLHVCVSITLIGATLAFTRFHSAAALLTFGGALGLAVQTFTPLGFALLGPLEDPYRKLPLPDRVDTIVVLGGGVDWTVVAGRDRMELSAAGDRLTSAISLLRRYPDAVIVYSGRERGVIESPEDSDVARFLTVQGVAPERIVLESNSRNTEENVRLLAATLGEASPGTARLLVTSAFHLRRALAMFDRHGLDVIPYATDFRSPGPDVPWKWFRDTHENLRNVDLATKEWIGLVVYRLRNHTYAARTK